MIPNRKHPTLRLLLAALAAGLLAACASVPPPTVQRGADPLAAAADTTDTVQHEVAATGVQPVIRRGNGEVIDRAAAASPVRDLPDLSSATTGAATFNFEGAPIQVVVKAILGEMLGQNYVIQPGVQGTVTLATPKPVSPAAARDLLEMVLGWNNARLVYSGGRYNIVAADQPLAGAVAPRSGPASTARGYETRIVPLRYISATEMA